MMTSTMNRPSIDLPRGTSETFTEEPTTSTTPGTARPLKVPSCRPTPLIGTWADESWPLNSRQASEIITEQVLQQQRSSIIFEDDEGNALLLNADLDEASTSSGDQGTINESMMHEAMSHAQTTEEVSTAGGSSTTTARGGSSPTHVAQAYMFDPYHISNSRTVLYRCVCEVCVPMLQERHHHRQEQEEITSSQVSPSGPMAVDDNSSLRSTTQSFVAAPPQYVDEEDKGDWDLPTYTPLPKSQGGATYTTYPGRSAPAPQTHQFPTAPTAASKQSSSASSSFMTHTQVSGISNNGSSNGCSPGSLMNAPSAQTQTQTRTTPATRSVAGASTANEITAFMPPPPPPRITTMVFGEEGSIQNPSGIYYHLIMRWYAKVQESQMYFVRADDECPAPSKDRYSFDEWADKISGWWYTHFEKMQKNARRSGPRYPPRQF